MELFSIRIQRTFQLVSTADTDVRRISGLERHGEIRKGTGIAIL